MLPHGNKPQQQQLGLGTGVEVVRIDRPSSSRPYTMASPSVANAAATVASSPNYKSPWAAKKANRRLAWAPTDPALARRLNREAATLRQLNHPGVIGYRGLVDDNDDNDVPPVSHHGGAASNKPVSLLMQFGGRSLMDLIEERREDAVVESAAPAQPFPPAFIASVIGQAAEALDYLHTERQLLHGDVKSANMLLLHSDDGGGACRLRLCDFGSALPLCPATLEVAASASSEAAAAAGDDLEFRGTELWAPPEALHPGAAIGHKADLWSLGMVIYELLALDVPHGDIFGDGDGDSAATEEEGDSSVASSAGGCGLDSLLAHRFGTRPPLPARLLAAPLHGQFEALIGVYHWLTAQDPAERPSARQLADRMAQLAKTMKENDEPGVVVV